MKLLLGAFPPELGDLLERTPEGWVCACTDLGAVAAAVATTRLLRDLLPEQVLFLGTCGSYDPAQLPVGTLVAVSDVLATSAEEAAGGAYRPPAERARWMTDFRVDLPAFPVASTPAITTSLESVRRLAAVAPLEHLELAGVMEACRTAGIPVGAALAVANAVGPDANAEWRANHAEASARLVRRLRASGWFGRAH